MDTIEHKKAVLARVQSLADPIFQCDEKAVLDAYQSQWENKSSLAIKILSIVGGFLAMLAFLGFLAITGLYESKLGLLLFGLAFLISAIWLNRVYDKLIIDTFSISLYIIGYAMFAFGLLELEVDDNIVTVLICGIAMSALFITQNYILSFISVLTVAGSVLVLILSNELYQLMHLYIALTALILSYVFLNEAKIISTGTTLSKLYNPVRIGVLFSLLFGLVIIGKKHLIAIPQNYIWISSIVMILVLSYLVSRIVKINDITSHKNKMIIYALSGLILLSTVFSPSISGALVIILLSFMVHYKTGFVIGIVSFIYFISQFYYDLNFTLLTKSIMLFASGILFLVLYAFTIKKLNSHETI